MKEKVRRSNAAGKIGGSAGLLSKGVCRTSILQCVIAVLCIVCAFSAYGETVLNVTGTGAAAVSGITPEEGQLIALQRARADAVEKAAGIKVLGSTVVSNGLLVGQYLKTFVSGYIVAERDVTWTPSFVTMRDGMDIPQYKVTLTADVMVPEKKTNPGFRLDARIGRASFVAGDAATVTAAVTRPARIAVFCFRADDRVEMLYPRNADDAKRIVKGKEPFTFPEEDSGQNLVMCTLKGHKQDSEAFMIAAVETACSGTDVSFFDLFSTGVLYTVPEYFARYSRIAEMTVEAILPYEVREKQE